MRHDRLSRIREQRGLSQVELAERAGLSSQQIYRYENGKTEPDGTVVARIARILEVSTDYLLGTSDFPAPYIDAELTEKERIALDAWRRGERMEAVKVIVNDE